MTTTPEEVSGSHALTTAEQLFCTLTSWHERVSVYVKGGVANVVGARWRVYAINGSQRTLLFDASSKTLLNEVVIAGIPGQGDTIALYGYNPYGVTGSVKAYMVGWDPSAAVTPVEASSVGGINLSLAEQDVATLTGGYVNLDVAFNANGDPLAALTLVRLYALLGGADRFQLEKFQIPANDQGQTLVGSVNLLQNYMAGASEFVLTAQGRLGTSAVTVTGTLEGESGSAGAGGGGLPLPNGTLGQSIVLTSEPNTYVAATINEGPYVTQAAWYIDPVGGDNSADGLTSGTAIQTWAELQKRVPAGSRIPQDTTITFLSDQPDNSDPIEIDWVLGAGIQITLQGTLDAGVTGTFTAITPLNAATNQPWDVTLSGTHASRLRDLILDTTTGSAAWLDHNSSGTEARTSQWFAQGAAGDLALSLLPPANGNAYQIVPLRQIWVGYVRMAANGSNDTQAQINFFHLRCRSDLDGSLPITATTFSGGSNSPFYSFVECRLDGVVYFSTGTYRLLNCTFNIGVAQAVASLYLTGGSISGLDFADDSVFELISGGDIEIDGDFLCSGDAYIGINNGGTLIGTLWSFGERMLRIFGGAVANILDLNFGAHYLAGVCTEDTISFEGGAGLVSYDGTAAATFLVTNVSRDIHFYGDVPGQAFNQVSGLFVNTQAPTFSALKTSIASGGFGGNAFDIIFNGRVLANTTPFTAPVSAYGNVFTDDTVGNGALLKAGAYIGLGPTGLSTIGLLRAGDVFSGGTSTVILSGRNHANDTDHIIIETLSSTVYFEASSPGATASLFGNSQSVVSAADTCKFTVNTSQRAQFHNVVLFDATTGGAVPFVFDSSDNTITKWDFKLNGVAICEITPSKLVNLLGRRRSPPNVQTGNYSVLVTDDIIVGNIGSPGILVATLPGTPSDGDQYTFFNIGTGAVSVDGNGHNIFATTSATTKTVTTGLSLKVIYSAAAGVWLGAPAL